MSTTLQQIRDRAVAFSSANALASLTSDIPEIINRIAADERALFDRAASVNSYYYATTAAVTSTAGASGRTVATSAVAPTTAPVGRILKLALATGLEVSPVDLRDTEAELAPRYVLIGTTITEVLNDWSATAGAVAMTLTYVRRPAPLTVVGGALSQTLSLPDEFADLLELRLARYLAQKDVGRDTVEIEGLNTRIAERDVDYLTFLQQFAGPEARRFNQPATGNKT